MRRVKLICAALAILLGIPAAQAATCDLPAPGSTQLKAIEGTARPMLVHTPARPGRGPLPLVLLLHGSGGAGAGLLANSKLEAASDAHGFLVAAPDGGIPVDKGFVWNIPGIPTITGKVPGPGDADDVAYLLTAIDRLVADGCVDPSRVYVTGYSGGGRMASWLGCVAAERFAAIAPVVGLRAGNPYARDSRFPDPATCTPSRPVPVIAFAGDNDTTNPIQGGGAGYWQYPMRTALARWADLNGCRRPLPERVLGGVIEQGYTGCRSGADVVSRITPGAGHVWVADNDAMWTFFASHRRR